MSESMSLTTDGAIHSAIATLERVARLATNAALKFEPDEDTDHVAIPLLIRRRVQRYRKGLATLYRSTRKLHPLAASYIRAARVATITIQREMRNAVGAHLAACTLNRWQFATGPSRRAAARLELSASIPLAGTCGDASDLVHAIAYMDAIRDIDGAVVRLRSFTGATSCPPSRPADPTGGNDSNEGHAVHQLAPGADAVDSDEGHAVHYY